MMSDERIPILKKKVKIETDYGLMTMIFAGLIMIIVIGGLAFAEWYATWRKTHEWQFPLQWVGFTREIEIPVEEEVIEEVVEETKEQGLIWSGEASWYGATPETCLGCDENFIMANGEKLDDTRMTLAFNDLPLGTWVIVTNTNNGLTQQVEITDTGGFEKYGKIADLSYALKQALKCGDVCSVMIEKY